MECRLPEAGSRGLGSIGREDYERGNVGKEKLASATYTQRMDVAFICCLIQTA